MGKLQKREIIILVIAGVFVLYGAYVYLVPGLGKKQAASSGEAVKGGNFIGTIADGFNKDKLSGVDEHVIELSAKDWAKSPFLSRDLYRTWAMRAGSPSGQEGAKIIYSGYVDSGKHKMAILNGMEYRVGESLEIEGYILRQISPSRVVIDNKKTGSSFEVPLQE
jgi:hypothetical protein